MTKKKTWLFVILTVIAAVIAAFCALFAGTKAYSTDHFTFELPRTYKLNDEEDDMDFYFGWLNKNLPIRVIAVEEPTYYYNMTAAAWASGLADDYIADGDYTEISRGEYTGLSMDAYSFVNMQTTEKGNEVYYYHYVMQAGDRNLWLMASCTAGSRSKVEKTMKKVLQSITYTGDFVFPTGEQKYDNQYVSLTVADDKWLINTYGCDDPENEVNINYALADNYDAATWTGIQIRPDFGDKYENAQAKAEAEYEKSKETLSDSVVKYELAQTEWHGMSATKITKENEFDAFGVRRVTYYVDGKDAIITISLFTPLSDDGTVLAELEALLENLVIKTE